MAAGARRIELLLSADSSAHLDRLAQHYQVSRLEVISRLLKRAAARLHKED